MALIVGSDDAQIVAQLRNDLNCCYGMTQHYFGQVFFDWVVALGGCSNGLSNELCHVVHA